MSDGTTVPNAQLQNLSSGKPHNLKELLLFLSIPLSSDHGYPLAYLSLARRQSLYDPRRGLA
jgi:hypothetical protein